MRYRAALAGLVLAAALGLAAPSATAQSDADGALARQLFEDGVRAAREERWTDAVDRFQRSFDLSPRPLTMMNLAGALAQTGRLVEAAEAYRSFLSLARTGRAARLRREAEGLLRAIEGRIARVRIRVLGLLPGDSLRLDDRELTSSVLDLPLPIDPGAHTLTIGRGRRERSLPFTAGEGVLQEVVLDARPEAFGPGEDPASAGFPELASGARGPQDGPSGSRSLVDEPAFWIVIGAVVAGGIAAGIGIGVAAQSPGPIYQGNVTPSGVAL